MVKIGSVTAEILLILSLCGVVGWWGGVGFAQSFSCQTSNYIEVRLSLSWGCDNKHCKATGSEAGLEGYFGGIFEGE